MTAFHEYDTPECDGLITEASRLLVEIFYRRRLHDPAYVESCYAVGIYHSKDRTVRFGVGRPSAQERFDTAEDMLAAVRDMHASEMGKPIAD